MNKSKSKYLFEIENVDFLYPLGREHFHALRKLSVTIPSSQIIILSGPSGSGKSTLLNLLGLIEPMQTGRIFFSGKEIQKMSEKRKNGIRKHHIGFIFQQFHLMPPLSVEENVAYFLHKQKLSKWEIKKRVHAPLCRSQYSPSRWIDRMITVFLAFRNLFRNKRRTLAILLTIAVGSGALFAFHGFIKGVLTEYREKLLKTQNIELFSLGIKEDSDWESVAKNVEQAFPELEATSFDILDEIYYQHSVNWLKAQFYIVQIIILAIVLLARLCNFFEAVLRESASHPEFNFSGRVKLTLPSKLNPAWKVPPRNPAVKKVAKSSLGIFNTISPTILERKHEMGNLRANGESKGAIMRLILSEVLFLGIFGGFLGIALIFLGVKGGLTNGILMPPAPGNTRQFCISFAFEGSMVVKTMLLSIFSALIASFPAGLRMAPMPIAKALREG